jgi:glycosyltransferase involved in cell wall biosynthesis
VRSMAHFGHFSSAKRSPTDATSHRLKPGIPATLSVCIISGAEAHRIGACIGSVEKLASEIIVVVDERAADDTAEVAKSRGARAFTESWKGHIAQKNSAAEKASGDWILSLDADEVLSEQLCNEIADLLRSNPVTFSAYSFPRCSKYLGRWIRHGDWYPDRQTRLWRKGAARWGGIDPHDKLMIEGDVGQLNGDLWHYSMTSLDHQVSKTVIYADEFVRQCQLKGRQVSLLDLCFRPVYRFVRSYVFRLGFLDGWQGFSIAWMTAFYTFLRYAKAKEAQQETQPSCRSASDY